MRNWYELSAVVPLPVGAPGGLEGCLSAAQHDPSHVSLGWWQLQELLVWESGLRDLSEVTQSVHSQ